MTPASSGSQLRILRGNPFLTIGLLIIIAILVFAYLGPLFTDPERAQVGAFKPKQSPSREHLLGTDTQGRDVLATLTFATPQTLNIGLIAGAVGIGIGVVLGLLSGYLGGTVDSIIRVGTDVFITIPAIAILVVVATNVRTVNVAIMALIISFSSLTFGIRT